MLENTNELIIQYCDSGTEGNNSLIFLVQFRYCFKAACMLLLTLVTWEMENGVTLVRVELPYPAVYAL